MIVRHFLLDINEVNAFVVSCTETKEAMLIDVGEFNKAIPEYVESAGLTLSSIFITHDHFDHTGGLKEAAEHFGAEVVSGNPSPGGFPARQVRHGDSVRVGIHLAKVVDTPGHTPDGVSLIFPGHIFAGDALFSGSVGGTQTPELAKQQIDHIRKNLFNQPDDYEVHVGHGPSSTVAIEKGYNPLFV